jgi:anaerobic ribonucleoside-triphosphate reductase activating protein
LSKTLKIELAGIVAVSETNGPGRRTVIWVQGCHKRCRGCWNPGFLRFGSAWVVTPEQLVEEVRLKTHQFADVEGITFSGGEPFEQAEALAKAARLFRREDMGIMAFSGYTLAELQQKDRSSTDLLRELDLLVDGVYDDTQHVDRLWRSTANQRVHFLSSMYETYRSRVDESVSEFEVVLNRDHVCVTGFPPKTL